MQKNIDSIGTRAGKTVYICNKSTHFLESAFYFFLMNWNDICVEKQNYIPNLGNGE